MILTLRPYMKVICVSILFICLLAASFSNWLVIVSFNINQQYIAKELCVNRNNPNSTCHGHCYLCKQLNKEEKPEGTNGTAGKEKFEVQLFFVDALQHNLSAIVLSASPHAHLQPFTQQLVLKRVFHPPGA